MTNSPDNLNNDTTSNSAVNQSTSNSVETEYAGESTQIIALVCGIVGLFVSFVGLVAFVLGLQARKESKRTGKPVSDMMKAAFVLGIIEVVLLVITAAAAALIVVGIFSSVFSSATSTSNTGSSFVAGTLTFSDKDGGEALIQVSNLKPGDTMTRDISIKNDSSKATDAEVRLESSQASWCSSVTTYPGGSFTNKPTLIRFNAGESKNFKIVITVNSSAKTSDNDTVVLTSDPK
jgi:hypothetical protein